jgi:hypothetical protein
MPSNFAPSMTFHPEALQDHVRELERVFAMLDAMEADVGAKNAVIKGIIAAVGAYLEGAIRDVGDNSVRTLSSAEQKAWADAAKSGLWPMWKALRDEICPALGRVWEATLSDETDFRELKDLRNAVAHGNHVEPYRLKLLAPVSYRVTAHALLKPVYRSLGSEPPAWWWG